MHTRSSFISVQVWDGFSKEKHRPHLCQPLNSSRSKIKHILKEYPIQLPLRVVKVMSNKCQLVTIILGCHSRSDGDNVELRWWKSLAWKDVRTTSRLIRLVVTEDHFCINETDQRFRGRGFPKGDKTGNIRVAASCRQVTCSNWKCPTSAGPGINNETGHFND